MAYRWFCKLKITKKGPDHSTFSKNRRGRFRESEAFRFIFEQVLKRCMAEGLINGEGFAVEADLCTCPNGNELKRFRRTYTKPRTGITKSNEMKYRAAVILESYGYLSWMSRREL